MHQDILQSMENFHQDKTGRIEAGFCFDPGLPLFGGHFPEFPLLPGVVQIEIVKLLLEKAENMPFNITHIKKNKFLKPILPGDPIKVEMEYCDKDNLTSVSAILSVGEDTTGILKMILGPMENSEVSP